MGERKAKGREHLSQSEVKEREKVRERAAGRDCTVGPGEAIPGVTQRKIAVLPGVHMEECILPLQGQKASWKPLSGLNCRVRVRTEGRKPLNFSL